MKLKKLTSLFLCATILMLVLTGCSSNNKKCTFPECGPDSPLHLNVSAALAAFPPDTVMIKAGDAYLTWAELFVFLFNTSQDLISTYGSEVPWDEDNDGFLLSDLVLEYTTNEALMFLAYKYGLASAGFTLQDQALAEFRHELDIIIEEMDGKEALEEFLWDYSGVYSFEVFENFMKLDYSIGALADQMFGFDGSDYPDENVAEYAKSNGFELLMAMHILRMTVDDFNVPLEEAEKQLVLEEAERILGRLRAQSNSADFIEIFKAEMFEHSEDLGGLASFPDGYLFVYDAMTPDFSETTMNLRIGAMSGLVETEFGYHIILRLPLNYDTSLMTPGNVTPGTFRQLAAGNSYEAFISEWFEFVEEHLEFTSEYNSIDLSKILIIH